MKTQIFLWWLIMGTASLFSQSSSTPAISTIDTKNFPSIGEIIRLSPEINELIDENAKIEVLADGFIWAEGPVWINDDDGGHLLFSDIPRNSVMKWKEGVGVDLFLKPSGYTGATDYGNEPGSNGLILDSKGRLVSCEHGDRRISVMSKKGGKMTLVNNYQGKRLNSPNDACYHSNGDLYFTDPPYGVYRLSKSGKLTLLTKEMTRPNGIAFSPDEKTLYVAQSDPKSAIWKKFSVNKDGTLSKGELFYDATKDVGNLPGLPDGLKVDNKGNVWATGPGGVLVFNPEGKLLGRISSGEKTANCGWGNDGSVLYLTADMYICRVQTKVKGAGW